MIIPESPGKSVPNAPAAATISLEDDAAAPLNDAMVQDLNCTIARFGDDPSGFPAKTMAKEDSLVRTFAPAGFEDSFQQLHSTLYPCLSGSKQGEVSSSTGAAILMGPRGSGKSLLLERCLAACQHQNPTARFRRVNVNGIVSRGEDAPAVVYEIIRQLSDLAYLDNPSTFAPTAEVAEEKKEEENEHVSKKRKMQDRHLLRLRKSTFTSNLALLESTLKIAEVDKIPILLILDEFDSFTGEGERQVLLYHLLDRVATTGSNLCLIGLTSNFTVLSLLEKRVKSRAEGTAKVVFVHPPNSYETLLSVIEQKLDGSVITKHVMRVLAPDQSGQNDAISARVAQTLQREFRLGKDLRWFCRVVSAALSLYRFDCAMASMRGRPPRFEAEYIQQALVQLKASISDEPATSATRQGNICLVNGEGVQPRIQALLDMSKPQVALLLSARRILAREAHRENEAAPLTLQRMFSEYKSFRRGAFRESEATLIDTALLLLERGLLVPAADHSGGGPLQYHISTCYNTVDTYTLSKMPLHLPFDVERELGEALNKNVLDCSTALKEWGRNSN